MGLLSAIPVVGGIVQSIIDARQAKRNTDQTIKANMDLAKYQYSKDLEMWNRANEYNSPTQQMARYQTAGLNPNLIYGTGSASAGNTATSLPKYSAPSVRYEYKAPVDLANTLSMWQDFTIRREQIDNLHEQNRIKKAEADMKEIDRAYYENYLGSKYPGLGQQKWLLGATNLEAKKQELGFLGRNLRAKLRGLELSNFMKEKQLNWYVANNLSNIVTKGIGAIGIGKLASGLRPIDRMVWFRRTYRKGY